MYIDERHFVKTAIQKMEYLERAWTEPACNERMDCADQTKSALDEIKTTATSVQARGVYRAANFCQDVLTRQTPNNKAKMTTALIELKRLINSYADGLFEIDPEFSAILHQPEPSLPTETHLSDAHAKAVKTLSPLVHKVENAKLRNALKSLMQPMAIDVSEGTDRKSMSLDALIQPISNLVLSEARHCGKIVTVSYAADFADLSFELAETVQETLEVACVNIVTQGILSPADTDAGTTPQISLTGQSRGGSILFSISWMGSEINLSDNPYADFNRQMRKLEQKGGTYSFNNLTLSDNLKSRHTLYIKLPIVDATGLVYSAMPINTNLEMGAGRHA